MKNKNSWLIESVWAFVIVGVVLVIAAMPFIACYVWGSDGHTCYFSDMSEKDFCTLVNLGYDTEYDEKIIVGNKITMITFYALYRNTDEFHEKLDATGIKYSKSVNDAITCK